MIEKQKVYITGIDALRALAVLSVMIYHLDFKTLGGGFTGVDIFFVISGFVVSYSLSLHQNESFKKFIISFYARRVLRILPALFFCLIITMIVSVAFVPESWVSNSIVNTGTAAIFGLSNFALVISNDGYFANDTQYNPFTHTWSLAVEEQFYLIFPVLFFVWFVYADKPDIKGLLAKLILPTLIFLSFIYSIYASSYKSEEAYFYIFSRFWQLACGVALFQLIDRTYILNSTKRYGTELALAGVICLFIGFLFADKYAFPFPWALLPVTGTILLILSILSVSSDSATSKIFNYPAFRWIGKLSYSLYLWHWPTYTLLRWTVGLESIGMYLIAVTLTFLFACISFYGIEQTIRRFKSFQQHPKLTISLGVGAAFLTFLFYQQLQQRSYLIKQSITSNSYDWYAFDNNHGVDHTTVAPPSSKFLGKTVYVLGDSHVGAYSPMLKGASIKLGFEVKKIAKAGCAFAQFNKIKVDKDCANHIENTLERVFQEGKVGDLIFLPGLRLTRMSQQLTIQSQEKVINRHTRVTNSDILEKNKQAADLLIKQFTDKGMKVLLEAPKPLFKAPAFRCSDWFNDTNPICALGFQIDRNTYEEYRKPILTSLQEIANNNKLVYLWDPLPHLCGPTMCAAFMDGKPLFFDGDHLSGHGNRLLIPSFVKKLIELEEVN